MSGRPAFVDALERVYGPPSQAGFGSAVFWDPASDDEPLADLARARYRHFVGELWERWGEAAWTGPWRQLYERPAESAESVVAELRGLTDRDAASSARMLLEPSSGAAAAQKALAGAFDDPAVRELRIFNLGDGEAVSGLLLAARLGRPRGALFLAFLYD